MRRLVPYPVQSGTLRHYFLAPQANAVADYESVEPSRGASTVRVLLLLLSLALLALIGFQATRAAIADIRIRSSKPENRLRAAELEPGNGDYWDQLGLFREYDFDNGDLPLAIEYYQKALARDPRSDLYWMHLASAYEMVGEIGRAREAYAKAHQFYPISAEVAWNYGNFLIRQSQLDEGFAEIRHAVETDPALLPLGISRCWRASPDVNRLLNEALPETSKAYFAALGFLSENHEAAAALTVWQRLLDLHERLPLKRSFPFLDELIQEDRAAQTKQVWHEALLAGGLPYSDPPNHSLIWNGGFESDVLNGGLDWRESPILGGDFGVDTQTVRSGTRSLRVDFSGSTNVDFKDLQQYVPVDPGKHYHFRGYLRMEQITTESQFRFILYDPKWPPGRRVLTNGMAATHPWTAVEADVTTDADTHFLIVQLTRPESKLFDNKLSGTVWVDDVSLMEITSIPEPNAP